jgi:hypothetical protein
MRNKWGMEQLCHANLGRLGPSQLTINKNLFK